MRRILVGIDDTDNKESRGTGYLSRRLAMLIQKNGFGNVSSISRHQLFVHPDIPFTSQNSAACLSVIAEDPDRMADLCRMFIGKESADGADAGLAIAAFESTKEDIIEFGLRAKTKIVSSPEAEYLAGIYGISLEALTGNGRGIIGALAAAGLRRSGNDGRCIWTQGKELRDLKGVYQVMELCKLTGIEAVVDINGDRVLPEARIEVGNWVRPVIRNNRIILLSEKAINTNYYEWKVATREYTRSVSA